MNAADKSVKHTPELLPILKQAGVVDSGGKGLFYIFEGMLRFLKGQPLDVNITAVQPISAMNIEPSAEEIEPGQDYEVVVDFRPNEDARIWSSFYAGLSEIGTSIQVGEGDGMYRMHIHVPTEKRYHAHRLYYGHWEPSPKWPWKTSWPRWKKSRGKKKTAA